MEGIFRRRHLPHWDIPGATYFVTSCLHDSFPARALPEIRRVVRELRNCPQPSAVAEDDWDRRQRVAEFRAIDHVLDTAPEQRWLAMPDLARVVRDSLYHFAGVRYDVLAYVLMSSHLHWLFRPTPDFEESLRGSDQTPRERIMKTLRLRTARECNKLLRRRGKFWQAESYDHWVRDDRELYSVVQYIENNPVKAGLVQRAEDWAFSSACDRRAWGLQYGVALRPPEPARADDSSST